MPYFQVAETMLANGLTVLAVEAPESPTFTHQLWYRVGARLEPEGRTGLAHLMEHLMFRGTERHPGGAYDLEMQANGMLHNAWTGHDTTVFYVNGAEDRLDLAMSLEADRMRGLRLTKEVVATELGVVREERKQSVEDPPYGRLSEEVDARLFGQHPYGRPVIGRREDLARLGIADVRAFYDAHYHPRRAVLVVISPLSPGDVFDRADRFYGGIPPGPPVAEVAAAEAGATGAGEIARRRPVELPGLILAYPAPAASDRAAKICTLLEFILLHGRTSRLYRRLIYDRPLATELGGGFDLRRDPSSFTLRATARPGVALERLRSAIDDSLAELRRAPILPPEREKIQRIAEADFVFAQESRFELGQILGEDECRTSWRESLTWLEGLRSISPEEIQETAATLFDPGRRTVGCLRPAGPQSGVPDAV